MEIKCNIYPNYSDKCCVPQRVSEHQQQRVKLRPLNFEGNSADKFERRPDVTESASGLRVLKTKNSLTIVSNIVEFAHNYKKNIKHTYDHKVIFALIEKELYGKNSIDSFTHDADKMILYLLGFPKSFVSNFHRKISMHHPNLEKEKTLNLKSMLVDNIASSPEFKPEKKLSLREYFSVSKELQSAKGFKELLETYNYGENLDFNKIKFNKNRTYSGATGASKMILKTFGLFAMHVLHI